MALFLSALALLLQLIHSQPFFDGPPPFGGPPFGGPPFHPRFRGPPPFGPPMGPPPFRRRWFPPPDFPPEPMFPPEPWFVPPEPRPPPMFPPPNSAPPSFNYNPQINSVIQSVNSRSTAFQQPGQGYDQVLQIMTSYYGRRANIQYDPANIQIPTNNLHNELSANQKLAAALYETDIVLTVPQIKKITGQTSRFKRKMNINGTSWGTSISYRFLDTDAEWQQQIKNALQHFEKNTCIRFRQDGPGTDYIVFNRGEGCYSSVGKLGGAQEISIGYGCETLGIISHEIGHTLGFWHEQARPERDSFVRVHLENAVQGTQAQFDKRTTAEVSEFGIAYDYGSVMHYAAQSFSKSSSANTIETIDSKYMNTIGNRVEPSFLDLKLLNKAFCPGVCRNQIACQHGGYADPNNCNVCKCPSGLEGSRCERLQTSNCGIELPAATPRWRNLSYSGTSDCYWRIKSPINTKVRFEITHLMYKCAPVCEEFIEIKHETNHETTGFRQCCRAGLGEVVSKGDSILLISKASQTSQFVIKYKSEGTPTPPRHSRTLTFNNNWSGWSSCTELCGSCGTQYRTRCSDSSCMNKERQDRACNTQPCAAGTTRGKRNALQGYGRLRRTAYSSWCCAKFVLKRGNCIPVG